MNWGWVFGLAVIAASSTVHGQTTSTTGTCSPVVTSPKGDVTIRCESGGLTKAQADQQAKDFAEILNKIRHENLDFRAVIDRLDSLKNDVGEVKKAVTGRHLTPDQRAKLLSVLKSSGHIDIYVFVPMDGGSEVSAYAMDFLSLQQEAGDGSSENYGYGGFNHMTGLQMNFNPDDIKLNRTPKPCLDYVAAIAKYVGPIRVDHDPKSNVPSPGACWLLVAFKD